MSSPSTPIDQIIKPGKCPGAPRKFKRAPPLAKIPDVDFTTRAIVVVEESEEEETEKEKVKVIDVPIRTIDDNNKFWDAFRSVDINECLKNRRRRRSHSSPTIKTPHSD